MRKSDRPKRWPRAPSAFGLYGGWPRRQSQRRRVDADFSLQRIVMENGEGIGRAGKKQYGCATAGREEGEKAPGKVWQQRRGDAPAMPAATSESVQKVSLRAVTRFPKNRTRSGCFTCRKRKKKCDEQGPVCSGCARNFLQCVWPSTSMATLPKGFEIAPSASCPGDQDDHFADIHLGKAEFVVEQRAASRNHTHPIEQQEEITDFSNDDYISVPAKLCSVIQLDKYTHEIPFPLKTVVPESIDTVVDFKYTHTAQKVSSSDSIIPPLDDSYVDSSTISQMFNSLYAEQHADPHHEQSSHLASISSSNSIASGSPHDISFYNDLLSYVPKTQIPQVSIKNPILASFREIFYARGCSFLAKNSANSTDDVSDKYKLAAYKHYQTACTIMQEHTSLLKCSDVNLPAWQQYAMSRLCDADKLMGLVSEPCISTLMAASCQMSLAESSLTVNGVKDTEGKNFEKALFSQLLFVYPFLLYFSPNLSTLISPEELFESYNSDMINIFLSDNKTWLDGVLTTAIINTLQTLTKLIYLLRVRNSVDPRRLSERLKQLKLDISLIWTTIQTSEIQANSETPITLVEFAKLTHMAVEVLYLAISDPSVQASSPIVGFYLDQFMQCYEIHSKTKSIPETPVTSKCFALLPLFVMSCVSHTLAQREYISKELYLLSRDLGLEFVEQLMLKIEDFWCEEEAGGMKTLQRFVSREGFVDVVNV